MLNKNGDCICPIVEGKEANWFLDDYLRVCAYGNIEIISYICGLINIGFWMCAQFPQIIKTFKIKKPESLSITFLVMWLAGDFTNLLGCALTNQTQVQLLTSIYFVLIDVIMLSQYAWYLIICRKKYHGKQEVNKFDENDVHSEESISNNEDSHYTDINTNTETAVVITESSHFIIVLVMIVVAMGYHHYDTFISTDSNSDNICTDPEINLAQRIIGDIAAWISGLLYFGGRIPQIIHSFRTKDVSGMSILLFIMSTIANVFYSISLFTSGIDITDPTFYEATFAYVVGSTFVIPFSLIVIGQYYYYTYVRKILRKNQEQKKPLLEK